MKSAGIAPVEDAGREKPLYGELRFLRGLARAFGGAILFALPLLMTIEVGS